MQFDGQATAQTRYGGTGGTYFLEVAAQSVPCSHPLMPTQQCLNLRERHDDACGIAAGMPELGNRLIRSSRRCAPTGCAQRVDGEAPCAQEPVSHGLVQRLRARHAGRVGNHAVLTDRGRLQACDSASSRATAPGMAEGTSTASMRCASSATPFSSSCAQVTRYGMCTAQPPSRSTGSISERSELPTIANCAGGKPNSPSTRR